MNIHNVLCLEKWIDKQYEEGLLSFLLRNNNLNFRTTCVTNDVYFEESTNGETKMPFSLKKQTKYAFESKILDFWSFMRIMYISFRRIQ